MPRLQILRSARLELAGLLRSVIQPTHANFPDPRRHLRRVIPILILLFLAIVAITRLCELYGERFSLEDDTARALSVAAILMRAESQYASVATPASADANALLTSAVPNQLIRNGRFAIVSNADGIITATLPGYEDLIGRDLKILMGENQALLTFGERAGVQLTDFGGEPAYAASATLANDQGTITFIQKQADVFATWRQSVSVNVTLFASTSTIILVILYAYFRQSSRAEDADAAFEEVRQRVDTALSRGHCGLWDWDIGRGRMYWSRSMYEMLGHPPQEDTIAFGEIAPLLHPDDGSFFQVARDVAAGRITFLDRVFRMRHSDGRFVWLRARAEVTRNSDNEVHLIGVAVDISEQQELARRTDEAHGQLHSAVENISETFVLCDAHDRLVLCNSKYRETFGLQEADVAPGTPLAHVIGRARKPIDSRAVASSTFTEGERASEALLPDGRWLLLSERRTADGGFVSIGTDITQLKLHQSRLSDSERRLMAVIEDLSMSRRDTEKKAVQLAQLNQNYAAEKDRAESASRAKTTFLANMSHELRTPLNAILGFSEIMRQQTFGPIGCAKYGEYAEDIHQSGHFLLRLIDDILDMAKIEAGRFVLALERVDLSEVLTEGVKIVSVQAEQKQIDFDVAVADSLTAMSDRRAVKQVVLNLLSNAVKFAPTSGRIRIKTHQSRDHAYLLFADNGMGIAPSALRNLGRPFEQVENEMTRTNKGTGLGLAIARSLVELHGGRVRIFSKVGVGTTVAVVLPLTGMTTIAHHPEVQARVA